MILEGGICCLCQDSILSFAQRDWIKSWEVLGMIARNKAKIWTKHFQTWVFNVTITLTYFMLFMELMKKLNFVPYIMWWSFVPVGHNASEMHKMFVDLITFLPFSTFCVATGLKSKFISFWSFSFFSFSSFFKSSGFLTFPPLLTWCWTCWMNRCCFAPFLFFKPNVLSCRNKYVWIKYMDVKNQDTDMLFRLLPCA